MRTKCLYRLYPFSLKIRAKSHEKKDMAHRCRIFAGFMPIIVFHIFSMIGKINESFEPRIFF